MKIELLDQEYERIQRALATYKSIDKERYDVPISGSQLLTIEMIEKGQSITMFEICELLDFVQMCENLAQSEQS